MCYSRDEVQVFHDLYDNTAILQGVKVFPYSGAAMRKASYRLLVKSDYDGGFVYFVSVYETKEQALEKLKEMSGGTFREVVLSDDQARFFKNITHKLEVEVCGIR